MSLLRLTTPGEVRDFDAERAKLLALPTSPDTDRLQDLWENDPQVKEWRAEQEPTESDRSGRGVTGRAGA